MARSTKSPGNDIRVDGYAEAGNDAATMQFGPQIRRSRLTRLGWQLTGAVQSRNTTWHPWARIAWSHDSQADAREVSAGLVSMPGQFALSGFVPDRSWGSLGLGARVDFSSTLAGWMAYDTRFSDASQRLDSLQIGLDWRF